VETLYPSFQGFNGANNSVYDTGIPTFTAWSMGVTAIKTDSGSGSGHLGVCGYGVNTGGGSAEDAAKAAIIFRVNTSVNWGCWNSTDSWLMGSGSASYIPYRLAYTHDGTTARKLYVNGTETVDNTVAQRPTSGDTFFCGASRSTGAEPFRGAQNFVYLRDGVLSAEWLAAEADNWLDPGSFYTVAES
jgi:hypothetical protein